MTRPLPAERARDRPGAGTIALRAMGERYAARGPRYYSQARACPIMTHYVRDKTTPLLAFSIDSALSAANSDPDHKMLWSDSAHRARFDPLKISVLGLQEERL